MMCLTSVSARGDECDDDGLGGDREMITRWSSLADCFKMVIVLLVGRSMLVIDAAQRRHSLL